MLFRVAAENQNTHVGRLGAQHRQRIDTALPRHGQIHQQNVDLMLTHEIYGLPSIRGLADNPQVHMLGKILAQSRANNCMVIHNANFNHVVLFLYSAKTGSAAMKSIHPTTNQDDHCRDDYAEWIPGVL